ncbi:MAG: OmpA family protein [Bdellovibrionales bacterium]|nr:OmpA family protein [Bdellovibrionales bacterium]
MTTSKSKLGLALVAGLFVGACASKSYKVDMPATAVPSEEISRLDADINSGFAAHYDVLAPKEFGKAQSWQKEAKSDLADGESQKEILDDIGYARGYLAKAKQEAEARQARFQGLIDARQMAVNAGARNFPKQRARIGKLDDDFRDISDEREFSTNTYNRLQNAYLDLELQGIQATQLDAAQARLAGARRDDADSNTPKILKQAELDLTNAYNLVAANRHNPAGYKAAVDRANSSTVLLVDVLAATKRPGGKKLSEDVALQMVMQNRQLASVKGQLTEVESQNQALSQNLSTQQAALSQAEANQKLNAALESARKEFGENEADVYRQGDRLLIRLKSMNFASGRSDLPQTALPVLAKVKGIASELNPEQVVIEGHTDATGSAQINQQLSQDRAQAVAEYLETSGFESDKIQTVGQGFQKPITSNKTKAGRAANRRVDVIIVPSHASSKSSTEENMQPDAM